MEACVGQLFKELRCIFEDAVPAKQGRLHLKQRKSAKMLFCLMPIPFKKEFQNTPRGCELLTRPGAGDPF